MARKEGKFLRGSLGDLVYKVINGKQIVSLRPEAGTVKLSANTIKANNTFGMAASLGGSVRKQFANRINNFGDGEMINRLLTALIKPLKDCRDMPTMQYSFKEDSFSTLNGFDFNLKSKLANQLLMRPAAQLKDATLTVLLDNFLLEGGLKFPNSTYQCKIWLSAAFFRLADGLMTKDSDSQVVTINRDDVAVQEQLISFNVPLGCLCIATIFLEFANSRNDSFQVVNNERFNPGGIIGAFVVPGTYKKDKRNWIEMKQFELVAPQDLD